SSDGQTASWWKWWAPVSATLPLQAGLPDEVTVPPRNQVLFSTGVYLDRLAQRSDPNVGSAAPALWKRWTGAPPTEFLQDDGLPPSVVRGQLDYAPGYAPPDPNLPSPLYSTRPESAFFFHGSFLLYEQTMPLRNQAVAFRGFIDSDGLAT